MRHPPPFEFPPAPRYEFYNVSWVSVRGPAGALVRGARLRCDAGQHYSLRSLDADKELPGAGAAWLPAGAAAIRGRVFVFDAAGQQVLDLGAEDAAGDAWSVALRLADWTAERAAAAWMVARGDEVWFGVPPSPGPDGPSGALGYRVVVLPTAALLGAAADPAAVRVAEWASEDSRLRRALGVELGGEVEVAAVDWDPRSGTWAVAVRATSTAGNGSVAAVRKGSNKIVFLRDGEANATVASYGGDDEVEEWSSLLRLSDRRAHYLVQRSARRTDGCVSWMAVVTDAHEALSYPAFSEIGADCVSALWLGGSSANPPGGTAPRASTQMSADASAPSSSSERAPSSEPSTDADDDRTSGAPNSS